MSAPTPPRPAFVVTMTQHVGSGRPFVNEDDHQAHLGRIIVGWLYIHDYGVWDMDFHPGPPAVRSDAVRLAKMVWDVPA